MYKLFSALISVSDRLVILLYYLQSIYYVFEGMHIHTLVGIFIQKTFFNLKTIEFLIYNFFRLLILYI